MKKVIFGIFAHPDDEAFGPAGTLIVETEAGSEINLITLTAGEAGSNPDNNPDLGQLRLQEWRDAGQILGASSMSFLGYADGNLSNKLLPEIADKIEEIITKRLNTLDEMSVVEIMSFELGGVTGHIDHIVATRAACLVFYRLKSRDERFSQLKLYCLPESLQPKPDTSWVFMDKGYTSDQITPIDVIKAKQRRIDVINAHYSQRNDGKIQLERINQPADYARYDYFVVRD